MTSARYSYPHTIDNGAGERLTFLRRVPGPLGERLEVENVVQPRSGGIQSRPVRLDGNAATTTRGRPPSLSPIIASIWNCGADMPQCVELEMEVNGMNPP